MKLHGRLAASERRSPLAPNRDRRFVFHPHILACLEILVVRHPSFTWNPIHHSAHLPGGAVHLIGPNRTRIGAGGRSIINNSFGWLPLSGQIHRHQPVRRPRSAARVRWAFAGRIGVIPTVRAPGPGTPAPTRLSMCRAWHRLAVSIGRPHLSSFRRDASLLGRPAMLTACSDSHLPVRRPVLTIPPPRPTPAQLRLLRHRARTQPWVPSVPDTIQCGGLLRGQVRRLACHAIIGLRRPDSSASPGRTLIRCICCARHAHRWSVDAAVHLAGGATRPPHHRRAGATTRSTSRFSTLLPIPQRARTLSDSTSRKLALPAGHLGSVGSTGRNPLR